MSGWRAWCGRVECGVFMSPAMIKSHTNSFSNECTVCDSIHTIFTFSHMNFSDRGKSSSDIGSGEPRGRVEKLGRMGDEWVMNGSYPQLSVATQAFSTETKHCDV